MVECRNVRKRVVDWNHSGLPTAEALADLKVGDIVRLTLTSGSFLWAEVVARRDGRALLVRSLDRLPPEERVVPGQQFATSVGAVFMVL